MSPRFLPQHLAKHANWRISSRPGILQPQNDMPYKLQSRL